MEGIYRTDVADRYVLTGSAFANSKDDIERTRKVAADENWLIAN